MLQGLNRSGGGSDAGILLSGSVTPLMYDKTAKPFWEAGGSVHLKNIPTNSSGEGMTSEVDFFFKGPQSATPLFLFTCESVAFIFYSARVETKDR